MGKDCLWKYTLDCTPWGNVEGVFIATREQVNSLIGKTVHFGNVLGIHSDVYGKVSMDQMMMLTDEVDTVNAFRKVFDSNSDHSVTFGYNPFDYVLHNEKKEEYELE